MIVYDYKPDRYIYIYTPVYYIYIMIPRVIRLVSPHGKREYWKKFPRGLSREWEYHWEYLGNIWYWWNESSVGIVICIYVYIYIDDVIEIHI
jgi:hypothetical protein